MNEIKVVIALKDGRGSIGVSAPECDPFFTIHEGGLEEAIARLPDIVRQAQERWAASPRYPKSTLAPEPAAAPVRSATETKQPASSPQPKMF